MQTLDEFINESLLKSVSNTVKKIYNEFLMGDITIERGIEMLKKEVSSKNPNYSFELKKAKDILLDNKCIYNINNDIQMLDWIKMASKYDDMRLGCIYNIHSHIYGVIGYSTITKEMFKSGYMTNIKNKITLNDRSKSIDRCIQEIENI